MLIICVLLTGTFMVLFLTPLVILTVKITQGTVPQTLEKRNVYLHI